VRGGVTPPHRSAFGHRPFEHASAESMMGLFLLEQDSSQPAERRCLLDQSFFNTRENRFAQSF
jgi:hypothetical protein